ncbi:HXXEE domain-containing protein [Azospirillum sp. ST 5-10]|uniref:HXXEE domain-containing protein n=1 Tax=unclassified Azospirillum TaxID=2630922 RepID=UPI003F4A0785
MPAAAFPTGRPRFRTAVWLMPAAFVPHLAEEYAAGFPDWATTTLGSPMTVPAFLQNNAVFMAVLLGLTAWAWARPSRVSAFVLLSWASGHLFWNAVFHAVTTMLYGRYSPGLATAVLLYGPVSAVVAGAALRERVVPPAAFAAAAAVGAALMGLVIATALLHVGR